MAAPSALADPLVGELVADRYRIEAPLAKGGMGQLYRATHEELGRPVALKVLGARFAERPDAVKRFQREARAASRLRHPNVVGIHDLGSLEDGRPFLAMELLEGRDLLERLEEGDAMSEAEAMSILEPLASALDAMHDIGILHRDIKPANIFLVEGRDGGITPKILDFGLVALAEGEESERLTREGLVVGTPEYLSPEAAQGMPLDRRADVYALGVLAFELFSGALPFEGGHDPVRLLTRKLVEPPPTMSERSGRSLPAKLDEVVASAMSIDPGKRPARAGELVEALKRALHDGRGAPRAVQGDRGPESAIVKLPTSDRRWTALVALGLLIALGVLLMGYEGGASVPATEPRVDAPEVPAEASAAAEAPPTPDPTPEPARLEPTGRLELLGERSGVARRQTEERVRPSILPPATSSTSTAPVAEPAPQSEVEAVVDPERAERLGAEAGAALLRGRVDDARRLFAEATRIAPDHAPAWRGLGVANERMSRSGDAARAYRRYLQLAPRAGDADEVRVRLARLEPSP